MVQQGVYPYDLSQILGDKPPGIVQRLPLDYMAGAVGRLDGIRGGMLPAPVRT